MIHILDLLNKDLKTCFKYAQRTKKNMNKELKQIIEMIYDQNENINKDCKIEQNRNSGA